MIFEAGSTILVRHAEPRDQAAVVEFNRLLAFETESKTLDPRVLVLGVIQALSDPDRCRYWVAELEPQGVIVGQAAVTREWSDWRNGWIWWLQSVFVAKPARGRGVFKRLFQQIRTEAENDPSAIGLRLYVEQQNHRAQQVYQNLGMQPGGYHVYEDLFRIKH